MSGSSLKLSAFVALTLGAVTSAATAMPGAPAAGIDGSMVRVDCDYGWYRGPDGRCYIDGTGPMYRRGYYEHRRYHRHRDWDRGYEYGGDEYRRPPVPVPYAVPV